MTAAALTALELLAGVAVTGEALSDESRQQVAARRDDVAAVPKPVLWSRTRRILTSGRHFSALFAELRATGWIALLPELEAALDVPQDAHWHREGSVGVHLALAGEAAAARRYPDEDERLLAVAGALLHDLGKAVAMQVYRDDEGAVVKISAHGHDRAGAPLAAALLARLGAPAYVSTPIATVIGEHMAHHIGPPTPRAVRRLRERLASGGATLDQWARVVDADSAGRGPSSRPSPAAAWLRVDAER